MRNNLSFMAKVSELAREYGYGISFSISEYDADNLVICVFNDNVRVWRTVDLCTSEYVILRAVEHLVVRTNRIEKKKPYTKWGDKVMTGNEYQKLAMRTCSIPRDRKEDMARHAIFGLTSEAGEVAGIMQKKYQGHEIDIDHVKKELGDCMWMIAEACEAFDISLDDVMQTNIDKLKTRYPEGFDPERSLHRDKNDI